MTDGAEEDPNAAVMTAEGVTLTADLAGVPANFKLDVVSGEYTYVELDEEDEDKADWSEGSFYLTGALNTNAEWKGVEFPDLTVTWSFAEDGADTDNADTDNAAILVKSDTDKVNVKAGTLAAATNLYVKTDDVLTVAASKVESLKVNGEAVAYTAGNAKSDNTLYLKVTNALTLSAGDKIEAVIDGATYTYTVQ